MSDNTIATPITDAWEEANRAALKAGFNDWPDFARNIERQLSTEKAARERAEQHAVIAEQIKTAEKKILLDEIAAHVKTKQRAEAAKKACAEMQNEIKWFRPEVLQFAVLMEQELRANDHKPGWKDDHPADLLCRVHQELKELQYAYCAEDKYDPNKLASEGADVANMLMMFLDVCGALPLASVSVVKDSFTTDFSIGRDYIPASKLDAALEALRKCVAVMRKMKHPRFCSDAHIDAYADADAAAEQVLKETQK